jgi:hypothetical protein
MYYADVEVVLVMHLHLLDECAVETLDALAICMYSGMNQN